MSGQRLKGYREYVRIDPERGARYNRWTVLGPGRPDLAYRTVVVRCDCGTEGERAWQAIRSGSSKSCGCHRGLHVRAARTGETRLRASAGIRVGTRTEFLGEEIPQGRRGHGLLYPERIGAACQVIADDGVGTPCPLVIVFADGFRGIAEPSWLAVTDGTVPQ